MTGEANTPMPVLKRGVSVANLKKALSRRKLRNAHLDFLPIKDAKLRDVKALLEHVCLPDSVTLSDTLRETSQDTDDVDEYEWNTPNITDYLNFETIISVVSDHKDEISWFMFYMWI